MIEIKKKDTTLSICIGEYQTDWLDKVSEALQNNINIDTIYVSFVTEKFSTRCVRAFISIEALVDTDIISIYSHQPTNRCIKILKALRLDRFLQK